MEKREGKKKRREVEFFFPLPLPSVFFYSFFILFNQLNNTTLPYLHSDLNKTRGLVII